MADSQDAGLMRRVTADTLKGAGWHNSWIDGIRRWHHDNLPAHFKTLAQAKALFLEHQTPPGEFKMTTEQKAWLDSHRAEGYRVRGTAPGNARWIKTGMLHADGKFEPFLRGRPNVRVGSFEVGVLETPGQTLPNPGF